MTKPKSPLESVDRALRLITLIQERDAVTVSEAAEYLGVAASTAHRLLSALIYRDFVLQDRDRRYRPGATLRSRTAESFSLRAILQAAQQPLRILNETVGETVQLMTLRDGNIQFVDGLESRHTLRVATRTGEEMPAYTSAGGKAILGQLRNVDLEALYETDLPPWPTGRLSTLRELKKSMTVVRRSGFGTNFEETEQGVVGLGVSINDAVGSPIAAVTTATPSIRFDRANMAMHVEALHKAAEAIESALQTQ